MPNKKIGLLGGSFNPAHDGHVYISEQALKLLGLDEIWWLVSPQNPLKEKSGMAAFAERFVQAVELAKPYNKIIVSDFEYNLANHHLNHHLSPLPNGDVAIYTYNTLLAIKSAYPDHAFVWLMGADNMLQFPKWYKWREIMQLVPVAVLNRGGFRESALAGEFANEFNSSRLDSADKLTKVTPPAWIFIDIEPNPLSSTQLRGELPTEK